MSKFYVDRALVFLVEASQSSSQKFVKLQEKSDVNFANVLFWGWITKSFTYFLKCKQNNKIW